MEDFTGITILRGDWIRYYAAHSSFIGKVVDIFEELKEVKIQFPGGPPKVRPVHLIEVIKITNEEKDEYFKKRNAYKERNDEFKRGIEGIATTQPEYLNVGRNPSMKIQFGMDYGYGKDKTAFIPSNIKFDLKISKDALDALSYSLYAAFEKAYISEVYKCLLK